jgi:glycosyltransferase involved in cell wall biosynthesis
LANGFARAGAAVTVIAASREVFLIHYGADTELEAQIHPSVDIVRVPFFPERSWPLINDWPQSKAVAPKKFAAQPDPAMDMFPERVYAHWLPRATAALADVHRRRPISLLLGSGAPYTDNEAATQFAIDNDIPAIQDDRDSFLADVFTAREHPLFEQRLPYFQRWAQHSNELWFVNPPIAEWHRERFPEAADRIVVVENGWDPGVVDAQQILARPERPPQVGYVGLVPTNFPMDPVLRAWGNVCAGHPQSPRLSFYGPLGYEVDSPGWKRARTAIEAAPAVHWRGHRPRSDLHDVYAQLDVLLLVKEGGKMVTGGKTYEYAASGLPIAALVDPASDAPRVLRDYPRLHIADPHDVPAAAAAIRRALDDHLSDDGTRLRAAQEFGSRLSRERMLTPHLDRVLERVRT